MLRVMEGFDVEKELMVAKQSLELETATAMEQCLYGITNSGDPTLDAQAAKTFKLFCRKSDLYVQYAFLLIMKELKRNHSEVRLSAFQMADELFNRSHAFREMLIIHLQAFLALTTETELKIPLPPPKSAANKLKTEALHAVQLWHDKFGKGYRKLAIGYEYLKNCKHIDFNNIQALNFAEQQRVETEEMRKQIVRAGKLAKVVTDIAEFKMEINKCAREAESCLNLLLPEPSDFSLLLSLEEETSIQAMRIQTTSKQNMLLSNNVTASGNNSNSNNSNEVANNETSTSLDENTIGSDDKKLNKEDTEEMKEDDCIVCDDNDLQVHGMKHPGHSVTVEITVGNELSVTETEDNTDVLNSLKESSKLITMSYLPKVIKWLEILSKTGAEQTDIKSAIDLKVSLENIKEKCLELKVVSAEKPTVEHGDSDDSEFEDVPEKEGFEPRIPFHLREEYGLTGTSSSSSVEQKSSFKNESSSSLFKGFKSTKPHWNLKARRSEEHLSDPTSLAAALARIKQGSSPTKVNTSESISTSSSSLKYDPSNEMKDKTDVRVVEFGHDLAYWENPDEMEAPTMIKYDSLHRFWAPKEGLSEKPSEHDIAALRNRVYSYTGKFEPVKWKCRTPMLNGKLCERMDRVKCPFHGKVIARDELGNPSEVSSGPSTSTGFQDEQTDRPEGELPAWQDPELQREIEAATGQDLGSSRSQKKLNKAKGKGKGKGKKSNLTDIKAARNTTRRRLEKRVFRKSSMKRVCASLDRADYKRLKDKFGNQFHYSLK